MAPQTEDADGRMRETEGRATEKAEAGNPNPGASDIPESEAEGIVVESYVFDIQVVDRGPVEDDGRQYLVEIPDHREMTFDSLEDATLYVDVYFDVNGFEEAGTGDRGVPPEIIQAGRDTLASYFLTRPYTDEAWVASFYGKTPEVVRRYVAAVRERAEEIREGAKERGLA